MPPFYDYDDEEDESISFGDARGMSDFEIEQWNGGYGPDGAWWKQEDE